MRKSFSDIKLKKNVKVFNRDVLLNKGYQYTETDSYSAIVANERLTDINIQILSSFNDQKTIIDIGCGDGIYTSKIKNKFQNIDISGFDPASRAIDLAKKNYPDIHFFVGDILDENTFVNKKYDTAIIRGVLHHLDYPELAIKNAAKLSDQMIIIEPNGNNPILKWIEKTSKYHIEHEEKSYSTKQLVRFCKNLNCKIDKIFYVGFVPFFFPTFPAKIIHFFQSFLEKIPVFRYFFAAQIVIVITHNKP